MIKSHGSSSSINSSIASKAKMFCKCGFECPIWTSNKPNTKGRRFFGCPLYKEKDKYCGYFQWCDEDICEKTGAFNFEAEKISSLQQQVLEARLGELDAVKKMEIRALELQLQMKDKHIESLEFQLQIFKFFVFVIVVAFIIRLWL